MDTPSYEGSIFSDAGFYSKAFDFYSFIAGEVDPRTGVYGARIHFISGEGNRLRGPHFQFTLTYSALDTTNYGFGRGWQLMATEYDASAEPRMLRLSAGDMQRVEPQRPGTPSKFPDLKMTPYEFIPISGENAATVQYATGVVEYLEAASRTTSPWRSQRIVNPSGDAINLEWGLNGSGKLVLLSVRDDDGMTLMSFDYDTSNDVILNIVTGHDDGLNIHFQVNRNDELTGVAVPMIRQLNLDDGTPDEFEAQWSFGYETLTRNNYKYLVSVASPDGVVEEVTYTEKSLQLPPGAPLDYMPSVRDLFRKRHDGSLIGKTSYDFSRNHFNYYGYGLVTKWADRDDQLIHSADANHYSYLSTETQYDEKGVLAVTIDRTYNNFHLVTRETTTRGHVETTVDTTYDIVANRPFANQKKSFQLPKKVLTTVRDGSGMQMDTIVEYEYDEAANLVSQIDHSTGIRESRDYYPPEGEGDDCPPDELKMIYRLKSKTSYPGPGGGPVLTTRYRYGLLPVRSGTSHLLLGRAEYVQCTEELTLQDGVQQALIHSTQEFIVDQAAYHGAIRRETRTQDGLSEVREFVYRSDDNNTITTTTRHIAHDGIVTSSSETKYLVSGLVKTSTDTLGNRTDYTYDALGRVIQEIYSPDEPAYRTVTLYRYQLTMNERWVIRIGVTGLPHRTRIDERGLVLSQEEPLRPNDGERSSSDWPTLLQDTSGQGQKIRELLDAETTIVNTATYDHFGQVLEQTTYDVLTSDRHLELTTRYRYDDWGAASPVVAPDGSRTLSERTLATFDGEVMFLDRTWTETAQGARLSAWQATYTDAAGRKRRAEIGHWNGMTPHVMAAGSWVYDGLGRCIEQTDAIGLVTRQTWDIFGRLLTTILPNGDTVVRSYAEGFETELLVRIAMKPFDGEEIELGIRTYDGLGRLVSETAGSQTHQFRYTDGQMSHDHHVLPAGGTIRRTYDWRLGETVTREWLVADAERRLRFVNDRYAQADQRRMADYDRHAGDVELRWAEYDTMLGLPSSVRGGPGLMDIRPDYLGRMTHQKQVYDGEARTSDVEVSLRGLELTRTGVDGGIQTLIYDELGRIEAIQDPQVTIAFTYDDLSRPLKRTTSDADGQRSSVQDLHYDLMGRVDSVTWYRGDLDQSSRRILTLTYRDDDKVVEKHWHGGVNDEWLRTEAMEYDDRGRLTLHRIDAGDNLAEYPVDEMGHPYGLQAFKYDAIDNILWVRTTLLDKSVNTTTYFHDAVDRDRVYMVQNDHKDYPKIIQLFYDGNGNLTREIVDGRPGHVLIWDDAGRLVSVTTPDGVQFLYSYGPHGRVAQIKQRGNTTTRFYDEGKIYFEITRGPDAEERRFIRANGAMVAETKLAGAILKTWLTECDPQGSNVRDHAKEFGVP